LIFCSQNDYFTWHIGKASLTLSSKLIVIWNNFTMTSTRNDGSIHPDIAECGIVDMERRRMLKTLLLTPLLTSPLFAFINACGTGGGAEGRSPAPDRTRTWEMGFFYTPPRQEIAAVLQTIDLFSTRSDLAVIHEELPWTDLINGISPDTILDNKKVGLVDYLRSKGQRLFFMADITDGLSRGEEAPQLRQLGRSITEPEVRQYYREYVRAVARKLQPDYIGLAAETNLIRQAASPQVYAAVVKAANAAAADLNADAVTAPLLISVQVETAWGVLAGTGPYVGIETDFTDFPFMQILGLSSYPYFGYAQPEDIPDDYYTRIFHGRSIPAMVCEGGWASTGVGAITSSPELQARYITRHADLLDSIDATAVAQTLFADIDIDSLTDPPAILSLFISIGLMDKNFGEKPALAVWDALFARQKI
jgi:hypothetical protein